MSESSGASGDTKKLAALIAKLTKVANGAMTRAFVAASADVAEKQLADEFASGRGPSGAMWPRPVGRAGAPLVASGRLRGSIEIVQSGDAIRVRADAPYAAVHQGGAVIRAKKSRYLRFRMPNGQFVTKAMVQLPKRPFLPEGAIQGPWRDALREAASLAVEEFF